MTIYIPKQIVSLRPTHESPLLFLAGPIRGGGDWQADMAKRILYEAPNALIACPSRWEEGHRLERYFHQPFSQAKNRQLVWERHYLRQAGLERGVPGCVVFWLGLESKEHPHPGPETYAMDTRREIGKFIAYLEVLRDFPDMRQYFDVRIEVGGSPDFHGLCVILDELQNAVGMEICFHTSMKNVVRAALANARQ